jgi:dihydrofolate reductase
MGKIIESTLVTLDGVIEDPANWVGDYLDESFQKAALERLMQTEAMLMGRRTYELLERDWAGQAGAFAERMSGIRKYVFSSTLETVAWNNTVIVRDSVSRGAARLKKEVPGDLAIYGHGQLSQTLLRHGLIDEIRLSVFPVIIGSGKLLFREGERAVLRLIEATSLSTGVAVMRYRPA